MLPLGTPQGGATLPAARTLPDCFPAPSLPAFPQAPPGIPLWGNFPFPHPLLGTLPQTRGEYRPGWGMRVGQGGASPGDPEEGHLIHTGSLLVSAANSGKTLALGGSDGGEGVPRDGAEPQYLPHTTQGLCLRLEWRVPHGGPSGRKPMAKPQGPSVPTPALGPGLWSRQNSAGLASPDPPSPRHSGGGPASFSGALRFVPLWVGPSLRTTCCAGWGFTGTT